MMWDAFFDELTKIATVYYHGTRPSLIPKIMKEGLKPSMMGTGYEGHPEKRDRPAVSLTKNKSHAQAYMNLGAQRDAKGKIQKLKAILGVGVDRPLRITFPKGESPEEVVLAKGHGGMDESHYYRKIPPKWISHAA